MDLQKIRPVLRNYLQSAVEVREPWIDRIALKSNSFGSLFSTYCVPDQDRALNDSRVNKLDIICAFGESQHRMLITTVRMYESTDGGPNMVWGVGGD